MIVAQDRLDEWMWRHPGAALALMVLIALACMSADSWFA